MSDTIHNSVESAKEYARVHEPRWRMTVDWMRPYITKASRILEVGRTSGLTDILKQELGVTATNTSFDVRDPDEWHCMEQETGRYDIVLNTEVIEHLPDFGDDPDLRGEMKKTGVINCLHGCYKILRPGGIMFVSTPNASSVMVLANWIHYCANYNWGLHVREYSFGEAVKLVQEAGFTIVKSAAVDPYVHLKEQEKLSYYTRLLESIAPFSSRNNRGETTFIIAQKEKDLWPRDKPANPQSACHL